MAFSSQRNFPDRIKARQSEKKADPGTDIQRHFPTEILRKIPGRYEGDENAEISRAALDSHGKIKPLVGVGFGYGGNSDRMIETYETPHQKIEKKHRDEVCCKCDQPHRNRNSDSTEKEHVFVFEFVGVIGDHDLEAECDQQAEVG